MQGKSWLDRKFLVINWEQAFYLLFISLALVSRTVGLGDRAFSHDEALHGRYSWQLYSGRGFQHNPMMHGPLLFHLGALSFWLLGDSDFTGRLPVALLGVALVAFPYLMRRQLGRLGALCASFLFLISPSILYVSRYMRNDVPTVLWAMLTVWAVWAYLQGRQAKYLGWLAAGLSLMFATKEVAYLYVAILGSFWAVRLVVNLLNAPWGQRKTWFQTGLLLFLVGLVIFGIGMICQSSTRAAAEEVETSPVHVILQVLGGAVVGLGLLVAVTAAYLDLGDRLREYPAFDVVMLFSTLGAPFMAAVPIRLLGSDPEDYSFTAEALRQLSPGLVLIWSLVLLLPILLYVWQRARGRKGHANTHWPVLAYNLFFAMVVVATVRSLAVVPGTGAIRSAAVLVWVIALSAAMGLWWDWRRWLLAAGIFYGIYVVLFTTVFTNGQGLGTGWIGSLGYWMEQQAVERGTQPLYFYAFLAPIYEFLPLLGTLAAGCLWLNRGGGLALLKRLCAQRFRLDQDARECLFGPVPLLLWWTAGTWLVYSYAGERMGWLLVHFAGPMILLTAWWLGRTLGALRPRQWVELWRRGGWAVVVLLPLMLVAGVRGLRPLWAGQLGDLVHIGRVLAGLAVAGGAALVLYRILRWLALQSVVQLLALMLFAFLSLATVRVAHMASFLNDQTTKEWLGYAHGAPGVKQVMAQVEKLSRQVHGDLTLPLAYDADILTVFNWYTRNYPNTIYFGSQPTRQRLDVPAVLVGRNNWDKVEPYLADRYLETQYLEMLWPMEAYKDLTWERLKNALIDPQMRAALWDMLVNRDFERYGVLLDQSYSIAEWPLRHEMKLYLRKDVVTKIWDYGAGAAELEARLDPYQASFRNDMIPQQALGQGELLMPRDLALGDDGRLYVVDSALHQLMVYQPDSGVLLHSWGGYCDLESGANCVDPDDNGPLPLGVGQFKEPWGVGLAADGSVYVADTWNHRVQRFTAEGEFLEAWGHFGEGGEALFYGPRDVAVGPDGRIYVTDTGNKRVQIFGPDGRYLSEFGQPGMLDGQMDEPVGLVFGPDNLLYVADTWNGRVDVFDPEGNWVRQWPVDGWYGDSINNKPYLTADPVGWIFLSDPEQYRILVFDPLGNYLYGFARYSTELDGVGLPIGVAAGEDGVIYVADAANGRVLGYRP